MPPTYCGGGRNCWGIAGVSKDGGAAAGGSVGGRRRLGHQLASPTSFTIAGTIKVLHEERVDQHSERDREADLEQYVEW